MTVHAAPYGPTDPAGALADDDCDISWLALGDRDFCLLRCMRSDDLGGGFSRHVIGKRPQHYGKRCFSLP